MFNEIIQGRAMVSGSKGAIESLKSARRLRDMIHQTFHIKHLKDFMAHRQSLGAKQKVE